MFTLISFFINGRVCFQGAELNEREKEPSYWDAQARATLDAALKLRPQEHQAKNIILFLGDGRVMLSLLNAFQQILVGTIKATAIYLSNK